MRINGIKKVALCLVSILSLAGATSARAEIVGLLEAPVGYASQVSNVQGWVYTTTPGAELIQPFDVRIDGVMIQQVPCCSDRGDVRDANPGAPLQTGFSGVVNWAREALSAEGLVMLSVVIRDTAGGELVLEEEIELYASNSFPFSRNVSFAQPQLAELLADSEDPVLRVIDEDRLESWCSLSNVAYTGEPLMARITCRGLTATKGNGAETEACDGNVTFLWDKASQGFKQSSFCEEVPRWTQNGNGTATDNETGLMWELKTGSPAEDGQHCDAADDAAPCANPHDVNNEYSWAEDGSPNRDGSVFRLFLAQLNRGTSSTGTRSSGCFAGYCDWRLPTIDELRAIAEDCDGDSCESIPGETVAHWYWSSTESLDGLDAWDSYADEGGVSSFGKKFFDAARAVRGASKKGPGGAILAAAAGEPARDH